MVTGAVPTCDWQNWYNTVDYIFSKINFVSIVCDNLTEFTQRIILKILKHGNYATERYKNALLSVDVTCFQSKVLTGSGFKSVPHHC